jgi:rhodanese-related sulfurtransferase
MSDIRRISPQEAHDKQQTEGYVYVDVRSEPEFAEAHPAGAVNIPFLHMGPGGMTPNPDFVRVMEASFQKDAKLILGCRSGGRSLKAAQALAARGYTDLFDQRAGFDGARDAFGQLTEPGWGRTSLPTESGAPEGKAYDAFKAKV